MIIPEQPSLRQPRKQGRTDLLTEVLNAVLETQDSYAKDWTHDLHVAHWAPLWNAGGIDYAEWKARA